MASITFTIDDAKLAEFKTAFLKKYPLEIDEDTGQPVLTVMQHVKAAGKRWYQRVYVQGKREQLAAEQEGSIDTEIIT